MEPTRSLIAVEALVHRWNADGSLQTRSHALHAQPVSGCDACRFADPFSDCLCTFPNISAEDFDLGVSGINCSRFQPQEA